MKFNPDGTRFTQWMRPQNDGPALRAVTIIRLSHQLLQEKQKKLVKHLFDGSAPSQDGINAAGVIKADLDYIVGHWTDVSYDPWEEVKARHFYTRLVQRKALLDGSWLADRLGNHAAAKQYRRTARQLETAINSHWIPEGQKNPSGEISNGQIWDTFDYVKGVNYKTSGLDVAAILGALHAHNEFDPKGDRFFSPSDDRVLKTAKELADAFYQRFPLASASGDTSGALGTPIGRYPEDKYNGYDSTQLGNPWYLATAAFAELYYRCAEEWQKDGKINITSINVEFLGTLAPAASIKVGETIASGDERFGILTSAIRQLGDSYLRRVQAHEGTDGHLTEEFMRTDGSPTGAQDLSWSYASILTAAQHRQ